LAPLSPNRYKVQFTADEALKDKLERAQNLMSHTNPSGELAEVVERAIDLLLLELERKKLGRAARPRAPQGTQRGSIGRATRREVFQRDGARCAYVSEDGRRCEARAFLELDHIEPRALGGSGESGNVRVLCRAHNQLCAEKVFGKEHVALQTNLRQRKSGRKPAREPDPQYDKLLGALVGLGFRAKPTEAVLDLMRGGKSSVAWSAPLDHLLREAAQLLTR
jgi:5-methylcytosine-specific restriction endonuclease McrA